MILLALPLLAACNSASSGKDAKSAPSETDLLNHRYVLSSVDGKKFANSERTPEIEFGKDMRITGQVCNRFNGNGQLKDGVLTVPQMATTMMACADTDLNKMERDFAAILRSGAKISFDGKTLTLSGEGVTLEYIEVSARRERSASGNTLPMACRTSAPGTMSSKSP